MDKTVKEYMQSFAVMATLSLVHLFIMRIPISESIRCLKHINVHCLWHIRKRFDAACATIDNLNLKNYDICILIRGRDSNETEANQIESYITSHYTRKISVPAEAVIPVSLISEGV